MALNAMIDVRRLTLLAMIATSLACACLSPAASQFRIRTVNPFSVKSPTGRTVLWINPSDSRGEGAARYTAMRDGKPLWKVTLPYTLLKVAIGDDGLAAGCSDDSEFQKEPVIVVAAIDSNGVAHVLDSIKQDGPRVPDGPLEPQPLGVILDSSTDHFIARTGNGPSISAIRETWRSYSLKTFAKTRVNPLAVGNENDPRRYVLAAAAIPGTEFVLVDWYTFNDRTMGQEFDLLDRQLNVVWRKELPDDLENGRKEDHRFDLREEVEASGPILDASRSDRFTVRFVKSSQRVTFAISNISGAVSVSEVGRAPFSKKAKASKAAGIPSVVLGPVRSVRIPRTADPPNPVHDVESFYLSQRGLVLLRSGAHPSVGIVDRDGRQKASFPLPKIPAASNLFLAKVGDSKALVVATQPDGPGMAQAWTVDLVRGSVSRLVKFAAFHVSSLAAYPDGRFCVVSSESIPYSMVDHLSFYRADGSRIWMLGEAGYSGRRDEIESPEGVSIDSRGNIVTIASVGGLIQTIDPSGKVKSVIDLNKAWGKDPSYQSNILCAPDGRFLLDDDDLKILASNGKIERHFTPRLSSGKEVTVRSPLQFDALGRIWISDGYSIYRLRLDGIPDLVVGNKPRSTGLGDIVNLRIAQDGRVFAQDRVTGAISVFESTGRSLFVAEASKAASSDRYGFMLSFRVSRSGDLYVDCPEPLGWIHYSRAGKRLSFLPRAHDRPTTTPFGSNPASFWSGVSLRDRKGSLVGEIDRWPDQAWIDSMATLADSIMEAPDGSLAIVGSVNSKGFAEANTRMAFYSRQGVPLTLVSLPPEVAKSSSEAFDGRHVYCVTDKGLIALDKKGAALWRYRPKSWTGNETVFSSLGTIAIYDGNRTVTWYNAPR